MTTHKAKARRVAKARGAPRVAKARAYAHARARRRRGGLVLSLRFAGEPIGDSAAFGEPFGDSKALCGIHTIFVLSGSGSTTFAFALIAPSAHSARRRSASVSRFAAEGSPKDPARHSIVTFDGRGMVMVRSFFAPSAMRARSGDWERRTTFVGEPGRAREKLGESARRRAPAARRPERALGFGDDERRARPSAFEGRIAPGGHGAVEPCGAT